MKANESFKLQMSYECQRKNASAMGHPKWLVCFNGFGVAHIPMATIRVIDQEGFYSEKTSEKEPDGTYVAEIQVVAKEKRDNSQPSDNDQQKDSSQITKKDDNDQQKAAPPLVEAILKIYAFFKEEISYETIIKAIHHNEGLLENAIKELSQDPFKYNSTSLVDAPFHQADFPIENYYSYIEFGNSQ